MPYVLAEVFDREGCHMKTSRGHAWQGVAVSLACTLIATCLTAPVKAVAAPSTAVAAASEPSPEQSLEEASAAAASSGRPVVVDEMTSETTQVIAKPDGTFTMDSYRAPVRVETEAGWRAVDDSLRANSDGSYSPVATPADVRFSGGGTGPLVTFATDEGEVSLTWPVPLPTPRISGDTATYADVLPGVDLDLIASPEGYKQLITVKNRAAAENPDLQSLSMTARTDGLRLSATSHGALTATNDSGEVVLSGPRPYQWDSATAPKAEAPTDEVTGAGKVDLASVTLAPADGTLTPATTELELAPDLKALADPATVFPVRIDPSMTDTRDHYITVQSGGWNYYDNTSEPMRVGKCYNVYGECSAINGVARSYFSFNTDPLTDVAVDAKVFDARVLVTQIHNASCSATPVALYSAGAFGSTTTWNGPQLDSLQTISSKAGNAACGNADAELKFNNAAVDARLQDIANNDTDVVYFGLISTNETNWDYWKKFSINPHLEVDFDFGVDAPTGLGVVGSVACPGKPVYANAKNANNVPIPETYVAQANNRNPNYGTVDLVFQVSSFTAPSTYTLLQDSGQFNVKENTPSTWNSAAASTTALAEGTYALRVQSQSASPDNTDLGAWSGYYPFTIDRTVPAGTPTVASFDYPADNWGAPADYADGTFNLAASSDTAFFAYAIDGTGLPAVTNTTCGYTTKTADKRGGFVPAVAGKAALVPGAALAPGYHSILVKAYDDAHNASGASLTYSFYVSPAAGATTSHNPNRVEAETLSISQSPTQLAATMPGFSGPGYPTYIETNSSWFSGGQESHIIAPASTVPSVTVPEFTYTLPAVEDGTYALGVRLTKIYHFAKLEFSLDGQPIRASSADAPLRADSYFATRDFYYVNLGERKLTPGTHTITVRLVDKNASATPYTYNGTYGTAQGSVVLSSASGMSAGIDFFTVAKLSGTAFPTLSSTFNNNGITTDTDTTTTAGNLTNTLTGSKSLSESALAAMGLGTGQAKTIAVPNFGNVVFTRPVPVGGKDNVIALGQTIAIANQPLVTSTTAVHLLVTSSCGTLPDSPSNVNRLKFILADAPDDPVYSDHSVGIVPDWLSTTTTALPTVTMTSYKTGTTTTTGTNRLFVISAKPGPDYVASNLAAITLPELPGTTLAAGTCSTPTLHVLALAVQP